MFAFIKSMYLMGRMTAAQVWAAVAKGQISRDQALQICGPMEVE